MLHGTANHISLSFSCSITPLLTNVVTNNMSTKFMMELIAYPLINPWAEADTYSCDGDGFRFNSCYKYAWMELWDFRRINFPRITGIRVCVMVRYTFIVINPGKAMVKSTIFITVYRWQSIKYRWAHVSRVYAYEICFGIHDSVTSASLIINKYMFIEHPNWKKIFSYLIWRVFQHAHIMYIYLVIEFQPFQFSTSELKSEVKPNHTPETEDSRYTLLLYFVFRVLGNLIGDFFIISEIDFHIF